MAKRNRIIAAVKRRYHKRNQKFGIKVRNDWDEAVKFDPPPYFQEIKFHLIFDVKMEDFCRKERLVAGGHMTESPATLT